MSGETGARVRREALRAEIRDIEGEMATYLSRLAALDGERAAREQELDAIGAAE